MKVYVDTNILIAASVRAHPHHVQAFDLVNNVNRFLKDNVIPHFELVALSAGDYKEVLNASAKAGLVGGMVYDALHLQNARKAGCDRIYTFNVRDFRALAPDDLNDTISAP